MIEHEWNWNGKEFYKVIGIKDERPIKKYMSMREALKIINAAQEMDENMAREIIDTLEYVVRKSSIDISRLPEQLDALESYAEMLRGE